MSDNLVSVGRTVTLIRLLILHPLGLTLDEIYQAVDVNKTVLLRYLMSLQSRDTAQRVGNKWLIHPDYLMCHIEGIGLLT